MPKAIRLLQPPGPDAIAAAARMKILVISFDDGQWAAVHLVNGLHERGVKVATLSTMQSALRQNRFPGQRYAMADVDSAPSIEWALAEAMQDWRPSLVLPGDERAVAFLHALMRRARSGARTRLDDESLAILAGSVGEYEHYSASS